MLLLFNDLLDLLSVFLLDGIEKHFGDDSSAGFLIIRFVLLDLRLEAPEALPVHKLLLYSLDKVLSVLSFEFLQKISFI